MSQITINNLQCESKELTASEAGMVTGGGLTFGELKDNFYKQADFVKTCAKFAVTGWFVPWVGPVLGGLGLAYLALSPAIVSVDFTKQLIEDIKD
ncbi:MAG: hypothetical protein GY754_42330 [bacterium]|nr:hypothetical protein [bacterium]